MATDPALLRAQGDWLARLRELLNLPAHAGRRPDPQHRSTRKAAATLLDNLRHGVGQAGTSDLDAAVVEKVLFNAIDQILSDKAAETKHGKSKADAARRLRTELVAQFDALEGDKALVAGWKDQLKQAIAGIVLEETSRAVAKDMLDAAGPGKAYPQAADHLVRQGQEALRADLVLTGESHLTPSQTLTLLRRELLRQATERAGSGAVDPAWMAQVQGSIDRLQLSEMSAELDSEKAASRRLELVAQCLPSLLEMLQRDDGRQALAQRPAMAGVAVASLDTAQLARLNLDASFGAGKQEVLSHALRAMAQKAQPPGDGSAPERARQLDPAVFSALAAQVSAAEWNDAQRGLGPRVLAGLFVNGHVDQVLELIRVGASSRLAARAGQAESGASNGVYSGFVKPLQHMLAPALHDIARLDRHEAINDPQRQREAQSAKRIWALIAQRGEAITLTDWDQVTRCEMVQRFKDEPGTIWGFENIRMPFVEAAQETPKGDQPLRMMDIWPSVEPMLENVNEQALYRDPDTTIERLVTRGLESSKVAQQSEAYKKAYAEAVRAFMREFVEQMPKTSVTRPIDGARDTPSAADVSGVLAGKLRGGLACQVGLHCARHEGKPVYYCLDGISLAEVADYKIVRNKAIDEFIAAGGQPAKAQGFDEVITLMEIREILKRWDELQDTVRFVFKGKLLSKEEAQRLVQLVGQRMRASNREAGHTPAPPRAHFARQLAAIDDQLMQRIPDGPEGDREARDIVRKFGCIRQAARTRPQILLRYLLGKCGVLEKYGLIAPGLAREAARLSVAAAVDVPRTLEALEAQIDRCHVDLRPALARSLLRHPALDAPGGR